MEFFRWLREGRVQEPVLSQIPPHALPWVQEARVAYAQPEHQQHIHSTGTSFARGAEMIGLLERYINPLKSPNILIVGLGRVGSEANNGAADGSVVPHQVAAYFQGMRQDFRMTLVDRDPTVIADVRTRKTLYMGFSPDSHISADEDLQLQRWWGDYLRDSGQAGRIVTAPEEESELRFGDDSNRDSYLQFGVLAAPVSPEFTRRLNEGSITLQQSDIATADLSTTGPFDFADMSQILYLLTQPAQKLALANVVENLKPGGFLSLDDKDIAGGTRLFYRGDKYGGWLTNKELDDLGLEFVYRDPDPKRRGIPKGSMPHTAVLRKKKIGFR